MKLHRYTNDLISSFDVFNEVNEVKFARGGGLATAVVLFLKLGENDVELKAEILCGLCG